MHPHSFIQLLNTYLFRPYHAMLFPTSGVDILMQATNLIPYSAP